MLVKGLLDTFVKHNIKLKLQSVTGSQGGNPLYKPNAPKGRVCASFWSENGDRFCPFWPGIGYGLRRNYGCVSMCPSFQFQMYNKESLICEFKKSFCCGLISAMIISVLCKHVMLCFVTTSRSENECENVIFWTEKGSGFGEPGGPPPPSYSQV